MISGDWQRGIELRRDNPTIKRHVFDLIDRAMTLIGKAWW
jgi:hypothetical protein